MTRDVANWFHDREGELFTESETPFTREQIVQVVDDSVDPVQQVIVEGEKYIGVISFEEHDGWYEYTRWDDFAGEINVGVCAQCVQEAELPEEVSRTIGDSTDIARQKFENHYSEEHSVRPDEIETGATLLSGTTVNGNEAIHPGMDGHGSGVDADFVLGNEALQTGSFYSFTESREPLDKISPVDTAARGLGTDSTDSIWYAEDTLVSIYQLNQSGSILTQFSTPCMDQLEGVGLDADDSVWYADSGFDCIYQTNQNGSIITNFVSPSDNPAGLDVDSNDCLWHGGKAAAGTDSIFQLNQSGTVLTQFTSPSESPTGVGVDTNDSIWSTTLDHQSIYKTDQSGNQLNKFASPSENPRGLGIDSNNSIWHADDSVINAQPFIYKLAQSEYLQF